MPAVDSYLLRMSATGGNQVRRELEKVEKSGKKTQQTMTRAGAKTQAMFVGLLRSATLLAPALGAAFTVDAALKATMAFEKIDMRLQRLTTSAQDFADVQDYLSETARTMSADILTLSNNYAKLLSLQDAGIIDRGQVNAITEGILDASAALGAEQSQIDNVLYGLAQALGQGTVQAQELNQVVEPMPGLLNAIADAAGTTAGGFRQMVKDGQVSSDLFAGYMIQALKKYEGAAQDLDNSISGKFTQLKNEWMEFGKALGESYAKDAVVGLTGALIDLLDAAEKVVAIKPDNDFLFGEELKENRIEAEKLRKELDALSQHDWNYVFRKNQIEEKLAFLESLDPMTRAGEIDEELKSVREQIMKEDQKLTNGPDPLSPFSDNEESVRNRLDKLRNRMMELEQEKRELFNRAVKDVHSNDFADPEEENKGSKANRETSSSYVTKGSVIKPSSKPVDELERQRKALQGVNDALKVRIRQLGMSNREKELDNALMEAGVELNSKEGQAIREKIDLLYDLMDAQEKEKQRLEDIATAAEDMAGAFGSAAEKMILDGESVSDVFDTLLKDITRIAYNQLVTDPLEDAIGGMLKNSGGFGSIFGGGIGDLFSFADGGVMSSKGSLPLKRYASGGIATSPQLALFGEGDMNEAYVPLPDGRSIPVTMTGGQAASNTTTIQIDARGAEAGVEEKIKHVMQEVMRLRRDTPKMAVHAVSQEKKRNPGLLR